QQKWLCNQLVVLQPIAGGGEAGAFRGADIARQLPEGHSLRGGEAVAHLRGGEARGELEAGLVDRRAVERVAPRRFDQPIALLQDRLASLDSLLEFVVRAKSKQRKSAQA